MNRKMITKLLAATLAFILTFMNVILLGIYTGETYAASTELEGQSTSVKKANIEFDAYFMKEGEITHGKDIDLTTNSDTLYLAIKVDDGYLSNGTVKIENANFDIVKQEEQELELIQSINPETNTIVLNQIDKQESVVLEIPIKIKADSNFNVANLEKIAKVTLEGTYVNTKAKERAISKTIEVSTKMVAKDITANLEQDVVKYVPFDLGEQKGVILQTLIKSNVQNNILPVKQTKIEIEVPEINGEAPTTVALSSISTKATNGKNRKTFVEGQDYTYTDGKVTLTIKNEQTGSGIISWQKNSDDQILLTLVYGEEVANQIANVNLKAQSEITLYNNEENIIANHEKAITLQEKVGDIVSFDLELSTDKLEKGQMIVAGTTNSAYTEKWTANIGNRNISKITIDSKTKYVDENENKYTSEPIYTYTKISRENFVSILGDEGYINIKDKSGNLIATLTKDNLEYKYEKETTYIIVETSAPKTEGVLEIENGKEIKTLEYDKAQLEMFNKINTEISGTVEKDEKIVLSAKASKDIALNTPKTVVEGSISNTNLSTQKVNEQVEIRLVLNTNDVSKSLYKNPKITVEFPSYIKNISKAKTGLLYDEELTIAKTNMERNENGNIVIELPITGEQKTFNTSSVSNGAMLVIYGDITVDELAPNFTENIKVSVKNENKSIYDTEENGMGVYNIPVTYASENTIITRNTISGYDETGSEVKAIGETKTAEIASKTAERKATVKIDAVNSIGHAAKDVSILGRTPFAGNKTVVTGTELNSSFTANMASKISATYGIDPNQMTIYYSDNETANVDLENAENRWVTDPSDLSTVKSYLIVLKDYEMQYGARLSFAYDITIPANVGSNMSTYSTFAVYYKVSEEVANTMFYSVRENLINQVAEANSVGLTTLANAETNVDNGIKGATAGIATTSENEAKDVAQENLPEYTQFNEDELEITIDREVSPNTKLTDTSTVKQGEYIYYTLRMKNNSQTDTMTYDMEVSKQNGVFYGLVGTGYFTDGTNSYEYAEMERETLSHRISVKPGHTAIYKYTIIAGSDAQTVDSIVKIKQNEEEMKVVLTSTPVTEGKIKLTTSSTSNVEQIKTSKSHIYVRSLAENISSEKLENVTVSLDVPQILSYYNIIADGEKSSLLSSEGNKVTYTIKSLDPGEKVQTDLAFRVVNFDISKEKEDISLVATSTIDNTTYYSSKYTDTILQGNTRLTAKMTGSITSDTVKDGDELTYIIEIENVGMVEEQSLSVKDMLPTGVVIKDYTIIKSDGTEETKNTYSNSFSKSGLTIAPKEKVTLKIRTIVREAYFPEEAETIENEATISGIFSEEVKTNKVTYKLYRTPVITPDTPTNPDTPTDPDKPNTPTDPDDKNTTKPENTTPNTPVKPTEPDKPNTPTDPEPAKTFEITGRVWYDENSDGKRDNNEEGISGMTLKLMDNKKSEFIKNSKGKDISVKTAKDGTYKFSELPSGEYIVVFMYDTSKYEPTTYQANKVTSGINSDAIDGKIIIDGEETKVAISDIILLGQANEANIDLGLINVRKFDLKLEKIVNTVIVQNGQGTKTYTFNNKKLAKVEIPSKQMIGTTLTIEYKISVTNEGNVQGTIGRIADYLPNELEFSSEINPEWYKGTDGYLYTREFANTTIKPGETKYITLVVTKTLKNDSADIINNSAEIDQCSNELGLEDIDSTPGNRAEKEDDLSGADLIVTIKTGALTYTLIILGTLAVIATFTAGVYIIKKKVLIEKI